MLSIVYPGSGNHSDFTYDSFGYCVKIVEVSGGTTTSTRQFVNCPDWMQPREERDGTGAVTKQFFPLGQLNSSTKYFYAKTNDGSIHQMVNNSGSLVSDRSYDPFGRPIINSESVTPDFGYAGYYLHSRSGLNLTTTRAYSSVLARFLNRDLLEEDNIDGGPNRFAYVLNDPTNFVDQLGLVQGTPTGIWGPATVTQPNGPDSGVTNFASPGPPMAGGLCAFGFGCPLGLPLAGEGPACPPSKKGKGTVTGTGTDTGKQPVKAPSAESTALDAFHRQQQQEPWWQKILDGIEHFDPWTAPWQGSPAF